MSRSSAASFVRCFRVASCHASSCLGFFGSSSFVATLAATTALFLSSLNRPFSRALLNIRCLAVASFSRMDCSFSRRACVSFVIRVRSARPTAHSSTRSRHFSASSILPTPSSAQAFLNHALWSSGSILMAASAASMASFQNPIFMHACAKFLRTARCKSRSVLLSSSSWALNLRRASSACLQLACASAQFPFSHSSMPSFLHFMPQFMTWARVCTSARDRESFSSSIFSLVSFSAKNFQRASYSASISSASVSPPMSIRLRRPCKVSWLSFSSRHSAKGFLSWIDRLSMLFMWIHVMVYCIIGVTSRFISGEQSSSNSAISPRLLFMSEMHSYCFSHVFLRESQCCSDRRSAFANGFRAALCQNSGSFWSRFKFGLCRGSVMSSSMFFRCHSLSLNLGSSCG
mmetsp:Transcript_108033/g.287636  ORF Transcript_108033/g.287636 Transcript_108033/m.287636 type:complete len:403 (-) Transcript_108033:277-1485(-)